MKWVAEGTHIIDHERFLEAGVHGRDLWEWGMKHSGKHETDGELSMAAVLSSPWGYGGKANIRAANRLVEVGLWERTERGFRILRWAEQGNKTRAQLKDMREADRTKKSAYRESKKKSVPRGHPRGVPKDAVNVPVNVSVSCSDLEDQDLPDRSSMRASAPDDSGVSLPSTNASPSSAAGPPSSFQSSDGQSPHPPTKTGSEGNVEPIPIRWSRGATAERALEVFADAITSATGVDYVVSRAPFLRDDLCVVLNKLAPRGDRDAALTWLGDVTLAWVRADPECAARSPARLMDWLNSGRPDRTTPSRRGRAERQPHDQEWVKRMLASGDHEF